MNVAIALCVLSSWASVLCFQGGFSRHYTRLHRWRHSVWVTPGSNPILLESANEALRTGDLSRATELLLQLRAEDPNRDVPKLQLGAFIRLFSAQAKAHPTECWPLEGLAALYVESERWDECLDVCNQAKQRCRQSTLSDGLRMMRLHAARAAFDWSDLDEPPSIRNGLPLKPSFIEREARALVKSNSGFGGVPALSPFTALSLPLSPKSCSEIAGAYLRRAARSAANALGTVSAPNRLPAAPTAPQSGERLVVGFISPDVNSGHPLGHLMAGSMRHLGRHTESVLFLMCRDDKSKVRANFVVGAKAVVDVTAWQPFDIACEVRRQGCHILVDLTGHAGTSDVTAVMALRPAALQVAGAMGMPGPMGGALCPPHQVESSGSINRCRVYDFMFSDATVVPDAALVPDDQQRQDDNVSTEFNSKCVVGSSSWGWGSSWEHHAIRLPDTYFVCDYARSSREIVWGRPPPHRPSLGLPETGIVLTCMNRPFKVDEDTFRTWINVLRRTRGDRTVLWLLAPQSSGRDRLLAAAAAVFLADHGGNETASALEASERVLFADLAPRDEHLWRLRAADLALDTPLYNSHTLGAEYLWAGVPLVTALWSEDSRAGPMSVSNFSPMAKFSSRVGASLVRSVGFPADITSALVANDWGLGFEDAIVTLACNSSLRGRASSALARGRDPSALAPLFNTARWARSLERGLATAWRMRPYEFDRYSGARKQTNSSALLPPQHIDVLQEADVKFDEADVRAIVLVRRPERLANFEASIHAVLPQAIAVAACDAQADPESALKDMRRLGITLAPFWAEQATAGQIGCLISHASVWEATTRSSAPITIILEDDAIVDVATFEPVVSAMVKELGPGDTWDLAYLYVYPDHWPQAPRSSREHILGHSRLGNIPQPFVQDGFHTFCLVAYLVSPAGAARLASLVRETEVYAPVDNMVSDWRRRGMLRVKCPTVSGFVGNGGQLDLRGTESQGGFGQMPSNVWASALWVNALGANASREAELL